MPENAVCGHRYPQHPRWLPCQLPDHPRSSGHRNSPAPDVQHVWQDHGHLPAAATSQSAAASL